MHNARVWNLEPEFLFALILSDPLSSCAASSRLKKITVAQVYWLLTAA